VTVEFGLSHPPPGHGIGFFHKFWMPGNSLHPFRPVILYLDVHVLRAESDKRFALRGAIAGIELSFRQFIHGASDEIAAFSGVPTGVGHISRHRLVKANDVLRLLAGFLESP